MGIYRVLWELRMKNPDGTITDLDDEKDKELELDPDGENDNNGEDGDNNDENDNNATNDDNSTNNGDNTEGNNDNNEGEKTGDTTTDSQEAQDNADDTNSDDNDEFNLDDNGDTNLDGDTNGTDPNTDNNGDNADTNNVSPEEPTIDTTEDPDAVIKQLETDMNKLTPEQKKTRNINLKKQYINLYNNCGKNVYRLNNIIKNKQYEREISFCIEAIDDLKKIIYNYLVDVYDTKTFSENIITYSEYLVTISAIKKQLDNINKLKEKLKNNAKK